MIVYNPHLIEISEHLESFYKTDKEIFTVFKNTENVNKNDFIFNNFEKKEPILFYGEKFKSIIMEITKASLQYEVILFKIKF